MESDILDGDPRELDAALDEALELTFPASDPIAVTVAKEPNPDHCESVV